MKHLHTIAVLALLAVPVTACAADQDQDVATTRAQVTATPDLTEGRCHLSTSEIDNWGETSARLQAACASLDGTSPLSGRECHLSRQEVKNWGETSARLGSVCSDG